MSYGQHNNLPDITEVLNNAAVKALYLLVCKDTFKYFFPWPFGLISCILIFKEKNSSLYRDLNLSFFTLLANVLSTGKSSKARGLCYGALYTCMLTMIVIYHFAGGHQGDA